MFDRFFPDRYVASTYVIDFEKLYEEGYRGLIFDIDNTLVPHGAPADAPCGTSVLSISKIRPRYPSS